jgi:hypothetical protein
VLALAPGATASAGQQPSAQGELAQAPGTTASAGQQPPASDELPQAPGAAGSAGQQPPAGAAASGAEQQHQSPASVELAQASDTSVSESEQDHVLLDDDCKDGRPSNKDIWNFMSDFDVPDSAAIRKHIRRSMLGQDGQLVYPDFVMGEGEKPTPLPATRMDLFWETMECKECTEWQLIVKKRRPNVTTDYVYCFRHSFGAMCRGEYFIRYTRER